MARLYCWLVAASVILTIFVATSAVLVVPSLINYQGKLTNSDDVKQWTIDNLEGMGEHESGSYYADYGEADQGVTGNGTSVKAYVDTISSNIGTVVLAHNSGEQYTDYTFDNDLDLSALPNVFIKFQPGARLDLSSGKTVTMYSPRNIIASPTQQIHTGAGTLAFAKLGWVYPEWWDDDCNDGSTDASTAIQAAYDASPWVKFQGATYIWKNTVFWDTTEFNVVYRLKGVGRDTVLKPSTAAMNIDGAQRYMIRVNQLRAYDYTSSDYSRSDNTQRAKGAPSFPRAYVSDVQVFGGGTSSSFMFVDRTGVTVKRVHFANMLQGVRTYGYSDFMRMENNKWRAPIVATHGPSTTVAFDGTAETIKDSTSGDFVNDGFEVGMFVAVKGAAQDNNGIFKITAVTATVLTVATAPGLKHTLTTESAGATISLQAGGFCLMFEGHGDGLVYEQNGHENDGIFAAYLNKPAAGSVRANINGVYYVTSVSANIEFVENHIENNNDSGAGIFPAVNVYAGSVDILRNIFNLNYDGSGNGKSPPILLSENQGFTRVAMDVIIEDNTFRYMHAFSDVSGTNSLKTDCIEIDHWGTTADYDGSNLRLKGNRVLSTEHGGTRKSWYGITINATANCAAATDLSNRKYVLSSAHDVSLVNYKGTYHLEGPGVYHARFVDALPYLNASDGTGTWTGDIPNATTYYYRCAVISQRGSSAAQTERSATTSGADGSIELRVGGTPNGFVRIWRAPHPGGDGNIDRYIDIPCLGGSHTFVDAGTNIEGLPWITTSVPARPSTYTLGYSTFGSGDTTPSVKDDDTFLIAGATIAQLDDGYPGKEVTLYGDGTGSIADSGNFELSAAWNPAAGDVLRLINIDGSTWREIGRTTGRLRNVK